jgi:hypothetical protein
MTKTPQDEAFAYQLDLLKNEIDVVNSTIRQMDDISKSLKEWCITVWAASTGGALATPELRPYVWATGAIPLLFWAVDSFHHVVQRKFIWRSLRIMDFVNDARLLQSFEQRRLVDFVLLDVGNRRSQGDGFKEFTAWHRVAAFRTTSLLYTGLAAISIALWLVPK